MTRLLEEEANGVWPVCPDGGRAAASGGKSQFYAPFAADEDEDDCVMRVLNRVTETLVRDTPREDRLAWEQAPVLLACASTPVALRMFDLCLSRFGSDTVTTNATRPLKGFRAVRYLQLFIHMLVCASSGA